MASSSRFAVALHILALLARERPRPVTSEALASSVGTNPAVARRILLSLSAAGLTQCRLGKGGGARLARPAKRITLLEVYRAVEAPELVALHRGAPSPECPVGREILSAVANSVAPAEAAFFGALGDVTLKKFLKTLAPPAAA